MNDKPTWYAPPALRSEMPPTYEPLLTPTLWVEHDAYIGVVVWAVLLMIVAGLLVIGGVVALAVWR